MRKYSILFLLLLLIPAQLTRAQIPRIGPATEYVSFESFVTPERVAPGGRVYVVFDMAMTDDWKVYALEEAESALIGPNGLTIEWSSLPEGISDPGPRYQEEPETGFDTNFKLDLNYFHETARFAVGIDVAPEVESGQIQLEAGIRFQICSDEWGICLRPTTIPVIVDLVVDSECALTECSATDETLTDILDTGGVRDASSDPMFVSGASEYGGMSGGGLLSFLLLAIGAGLASLLTPCVFPMIPLTVSYFTKHAESRSESVRMASVFGGSIVVAFTGLGIIMSLVVGAAGAQRIASNPWVNLFITIVLVGFALSLLGLYELRLPSKLVNFFDRQGAEKSGIVGVLFMGLTLTLVSFSCTAPFVGGLLAAASGGSWIYPLIGMVAYSAAFAMPFVLFALFPNTLNALPKSGSWMNSVKVVLGFIELAAAIKFLSNADLVWGWGLISRPFGIAFVLVVFFMTGLYLLGKIRLPHEEPVETVGVGRMMTSIAFFVMALYLIPGLLGAPLNKLDAYLPPRQGTDVSIMTLMQLSANSPSFANEEAWYVDDIEGAFAEAAEIGRPVLIDFTGYTCTNCREMEANVFPRKPIAERFERDFVLLRLYTDGLEFGDDFNRYQLQLTGTVALPTYAIVNPGDRALLAGRSGMMDVAGFADFLDRGLDAFRRVSGASMAETPDES